jgi:LmbE family N-acetylglucosaminyl deacetylase
MSILIVVAHSDDESIGMGGTIAMHSSKGEKVYGVYLTNGVGARNITDGSTSKRALAAENAAKELGLEWVGKFDFPDNNLDSVSLLEIIKAIEKIKEKIKPSMVYTHHFGDLNIDHKIVFEATLTAFRPQPNEMCREIRTFEIPSATDYGAFGASNIFVPNLYIDIDNFWDAKLSALKYYGDEIREVPHARSLKGIDALSQVRGMSVGMHRAEAFSVIRKFQP